MAEKESDETREQRAGEHTVLAWCHEGMALVDAGLVPEDFRNPLFELMEERFARLAGLTGELVEAEPAT